MIGIGYGDGYPREMPEGTPVLVNGKRRGIVGRISMDMLFVELADEDQIGEGERVVLWGPALPVEEIAQLADTIGYTMLSRLTDRVVRQYSHEQG